MHVNRRLLRTPRPYFDESIKGLIIRATEENNYDAPSLLLALADVRVDERTHRTMYTEQRLRGLSEMLNIDIATLQDMACLKGIEDIPPKFYNMFGHLIYKYSLRISELKICPECLQEGNYIRKIWDLAAFTCCPKHRTLLIDKCPKCGQKISWNRPKVNECRCGQDWREIYLDSVSESEIILSRLILQVCGLWQSSRPKGGEAGVQASEANPLLSVDLNKLLCAVYFIAGHQNGVVDMSGKQYAVKLSHQELHAALTKAVIVFENWPNNYYKFIEECQGKVSMRDGQSGLYKDFGKLYDPLFIRKGNPLPDFMRETFKKYVTTYWDGGFAGMCRSISEEDQSTKTYMTKHEAAKHLQVTAQTIDLLHKKGYLKGPFYPWVNRSRIMIEADSVRELKERWDRSITAIQAGERLGIGRISVVSLVKNGCLIAIQGPAVTGQLEWKFEIAEIERLLQNIERKINGKEFHRGEQGVTLHKAIQKLSKVHIEIGAFIKGCN